MKYDSTYLEFAVDDKCFVCSHHDVSSKENHDLEIICEHFPQRSRHGRLKNDYERQSTFTVRHKIK